METSSKTKEGIMNEQMKLVSMTFDELAQLHERCAQIAEWQEKHANLLTELAGLLGINVMESNNEEEARIIKV